MSTAEDVVDDADRRETDEALDEVHTPEVVAPSTEMERAEPRHEIHAAIDRAAEAALAMPGLPGRDEFLTLAMTARMLSMSGAAPKAIRNNPHVAFHVAMVGRDLGISPSASLELIDVLEGKRSTSTGEPDYRLSLSPQLLNGQLRRLGLGSIVPAYRDEWRCLALPLGPGGLDKRCAKILPDHEPDCHCDVLGPPSEFTWEMARRASLVGKSCEPGQHVMETRTSGQRSWQACGCNQGYITYPERMLWWRASGFCADDYFPEAGLGLYSPEALGAMVDEDGRPIDPATIALPEGYEPEPPPEAPPPPPPADPDALWDLQVRIRALPDEQRTKMAERWKDSGRLTYERDGKRHPFRPTELPASAVSSAESMVTGFERIAAKGEGWTPADARAAVEHEVAVRLCGLLVPLVALTPDGATDPGEAQEGAQQAPIPPDLSYSPEALRDAEAAVAEMTDMEVEDFLRAEGVPIVGKSSRDRAHLAAVLAAKAEPTTE